jgi:hypothetical protein
VDQGEERDFPLMYDDDNELAIAPPGPSKATTCAQCFDPLWLKAEERLRQAHAVVFMGYRFPETDAEARTRLLTSLSEAQSPVRHVVLGPDVKSPEVRRLESLLAWTDKEAAYRVHPLYTQDFMSVFEVPELFNPKR